MMRSISRSKSSGAVQGILAPCSEEDQGRTPAESCGSPSHARGVEYATTAEELGEQIRECIPKCLDCRSICMKAVDHYARLKSANTRCPDIRSLLNCSEICATAARFMLRGSEFGEQLCLLCAEVCKSCAEQFNPVGCDAEIEACAAACRECAECCERIAGVAATAVAVRLALPLAPTQPGRG